jgi:hypothetical protein
MDLPLSLEKLLVCRGAMNNSSLSFTGLKSEAVTSIEINLNSLKEGLVLY